VSSHLETELREQPEALRRLIGRGGFGVVREYRVHGASEATGYGSIGGFGRVPWALGGGSPGTENFLETETPSIRELANAPPLNHSKRVPPRAEVTRPE